MPLVDYMLFRSATKSRVALNIGGIANITVLPRGCTPDQVIGFDTGPGNMVIDQLTSIFTKGKESYDRDGEIAAESYLNRALLKKLLKNAYYSAAPPKSAGREQYGREFIAKLQATALPLPRSHRDRCCFNRRDDRNGHRKVRARYR